MNKEKPITINKSQISKLNLTVKDTLINKEHITKKLKKIVKLNAQSPTPVMITIKSKDRGLFKVKSVLLAVTKKHASLKGGTNIPIGCIKDISIF